MEPIQFNSAILKVASRCNINCDYCYVYQHADQSWKNQPKRMSQATIDSFALELDRYIRSNTLDEFSIIFHGGEPLLFGADRLAAAAGTIRRAVASDCRIDFSLQTNGTLLDEPALEVLRNAQIGVSLSLDGPKAANDLHRLDHHGGSTFNSAQRALDLLHRCGEPTFLGVISVIDPAIPAVDLFRFFEPYNPPRLDLLLPDATHASPPPGRANNPNLYKDWLTEAFHVWFHDFAHLKVRWFDAVMATRFGVPSTTDIMGFGGISLIVIDTDGSYTDHDVFKIIGGSSSSPLARVHGTPISEIAKSQQLAAHAHLLSFDGLAQQCKTCPAVASCAGGCVMHRYHPETGFDAPTVYCEETYALLSEASRTVRHALAQQQDLAATQHDDSLIVNDARLVAACKQWSRLTFEKANVPRNHWFDDSSISSPGARLLATHFEQVSPAGDSPWKWLGRIRINSQDPLLTAPFRDSIRPIRPDSEQAEHFRSQLPDIQRALLTFSENAVLSIAELISDIVLVESTSREEDGIFSFSDDSAPNIIYIDPFVNGQPLPPEDIADSLLHEFLHQVLYHYDGEGQLLYDTVHPMFPAPWRSGLRPASGFMHGTFVFTWLSQYWSALHAKAQGKRDPKFRQNALSFRSQALFGIQSLHDMALLTPRGVRFVESLARLLDAPLLQQPSRASFYGKQQG